MSDLLSLHRPQPLGALPWPAGMLLLPDTEASVDLAAMLLLGVIPAAWPAGTEFMGAALAEEPEVAVAHITGDSVIDRYNRAVLVGGEGVWEALATDTTGELRSLVDVGRFSVGLIDVAPSAAGATGEVAAIVHSARASAALEAAEPAGAADELRIAIECAAEAGSPLLAASLRLTLAEILSERLNDPAGAARAADLGVTGLPVTAPSELRAELQVTRALARQQLAGTDRGALLAVVADLTEATKIFREDTHPEMFAVCNQHLALAYLVMPMSDDADRIRIGIAVNALRAALKVFTPQDHPAAWASTQLNLANALQYLPSVHQEDNLDEAVQLYEEVLAYRTESADPVGYARILTNQANALGHLGVFSDARERLDAASLIFTEAGDTASLAGIADILVSLDAAEASVQAGV